MLLPDVMTMNMLKFHLGCIPGKKVGGDVQPESGPLLLYQQQFRTLVGQVLARRDDNLGAPGPYIPLFYQQEGIGGNLAKVISVTYKCFIYPLLPSRISACSNPFATSISLL